MRRFFGLVAFAVALGSFNPTTHAAFVVYTAFLSGPSESPPNTSPGYGYAEVDYDSVAHTLRVQVQFTNLLGTTTASHIHSATAVPGTESAGVATTTPTFPGFPLGVSAGVYDHTLDLTQAAAYNPAFVTANGGTTSSAEAALAAGLASQSSYLNIHTSVVPGGEIRGFLTPVPEPSAFALAAAGLLGLVGYRRLRRRTA